MIDRDMTPRAVLARTLGAILLLAAACDTTLYFHRTTHSAVGLVHQNEVRSFDLECPDGIETMTAKIEVAPSTGAFAWQIRDPDGQVRWAGEAREATAEQRSLTPVNGVWTVEFELRELSGNYHIDLRAESHNN